MATCPNPRCGFNWLWDSSRKVFRLTGGDYCRRKRAFGCTEFYCGSCNQYLGRYNRQKEKMISNCAEWEEIDWSNNKHAYSGD